MEGEELFDAIVIETPFKRYSFVDISEEMKTENVINLVQATIEYIKAHISDQIICVNFEELAENKQDVTFELYVEKV